MKAHGSTRVCLVTELLDEPFDEGMKVFSLNLARYLHRHAEALAISSSPIPPMNPPVVTVPFGKVMLSERLRSELRAFRPDILLYVPKASLTVATFLRLLALRRMAPEAQLAVIGLQPRQPGLWTRAFVPLLSSLHVFTQSRNAASTMSALGFRAACVPPGIDISRFHPVDAARKNYLRKRFGIPTERFTILHVGHLAASRNLDVLAALASRPETQVVLVASTSTPQDGELKTRLNSAGVMVVDHVVPRIEHLYQMADAYVFPVLDPGGSIEMPLSVLEAMACGLPVLTTPFGDLQRFFPAGSGVVFWRSADELIRGLEEIRQEPAASVAARIAVEEFGWDRAFGRLLGTLEGDAA
jgi:glycosyltransferase involved in cell wall biosynthesis